MDGTSARHRAAVGPHVSACRYAVVLIAALAPQYGCGGRAEAPRPPTPAADPPGRLGFRQLPKGPAADNPAGYVSPAAGSFLADTQAYADDPGLRLTVESADDLPEVIRRLAAMRRLTHLAFTGSDLVRAGGDPLPPCPPGAPMRTLVVEASRLDRRFLDWLATAPFEADVRIYGCDLSGLDLRPLGARHTLSLAQCRLRPAQVLELCRDGHLVRFFETQFADDPTTATRPADNQPLQRTGG